MPGPVPLCPLPDSERVCDQILTCSVHQDRERVCLKTLFNKFLAMREEWRGDRMASVQREAEVGCQDNAGAFVPLRGNKVECWLRVCVRLCVRVCRRVRADLCRWVLVCALLCLSGGDREGAVWLWGGRGGGVAAEAAGRTPASLLAPGAPLLSK